MVSFVDRPGAWWLIRLALSGAEGEIFVIEEMSRGARLVALILRACGIRLAVREIDFDFVDDVKLPDGSRAIEQIYFKASSSCSGVISFALSSRSPSLTAMDEIES